MEGVENYLKFTGETGEDFEGGWLPTLDTNLKVTKENKVLFKMYEKDVREGNMLQADYPQKVGHGREH